MNNKLIRVLVVDDHPIVRRGLANEICLADDMEVAGEATDGVEAVAKTIELQPDVILMDIVMPRKGGIEATLEICALQPSARILILTSFTEEEKISSAVKAGAMGCLLKSNHPEEVLHAIRELYLGKTYLSSDLTAKLFRGLRKQNEPETDELLTPREIEILHWVARGAPNKEIALQTGITEATVRAHVSNILGKLNLNNRSQVVLYAARKGLVDLESPFDCKKV
ncbi:MAG: response regulator transcription factor [Anaerolineaceae bacterium]|nr:response regulator transcription factor [Anaerolineaceae bacterium]